MKITYLLGSIGNTGGNVVLFHHMEALAAAGHHVIALTPYGSIKWSKGSLDVILGNIGNTGYDGRWSTLRQAQKLLKKISPSIEKRVIDIYNGTPLDNSHKITAKLISRWEPSDITIATHSFTAYAAALLAAKTKAHYHIQGFEPWFSDAPEFRAISELTYYFPLKKMANCYWLRNKIADLTKQEINLVRPGLNHAIFFPRKDISKKLSTNETEIRIVSYADRRPFKGWLDSIEAMKLVHKKIGAQYNIKWIVYGSIAGGNIGVPVDYRGYLNHDQLAELYSDAHLIFIPSWLESFPLQPIEAMACGTAVVTTKIGTEDFARHNDTALVVEPRSPEQLAQAICQLICDRLLLSKLTYAGLNEAKKYTWESSAKELFAALALS